MRKNLLAFFMLIVAACTLTAQHANAQTVIRGKLLDAQTKEPLIGATVSEKGTTNAVAAALDGSFKLKVSSANTTLIFSFIGYVTKQVDVTTENLGTITLDPVSSSIKEVVVTAANPSKKINRETPVAASSINTVYIEEHSAGAEFPELMKMTPGTTFSRGTGGYGDSRINIRGFSSNNVALLINGIPMNDPEAGKIYWNDWAGLQDVTTSMQIQRGLSASTVATPAVGGSIDITTRSIDREQGGTIMQTIGSYGQEKTLFSYSTGLTQSGWATSFLLSRLTGQSMPSSEGTYYKGYNYFANVSKVLGDNQVLSFSIMGASQRHGQFYSPTSLAVFQNAPQGTRYNSDWGYLNGQAYSAEQNFYNKPLASINYNWNINATTKWNTVLYGSWGTGAADYLTSSSGTSFSLTPGGTTSIPAIPRTGGIYSPIDFNAITTANVNSTDGSAKYYMQNVENDHQQYGAISSIRKTIDNITYTGGVDLRYYTGEHYYQVADLFGASYVNDPYTPSATAPRGDVNNPNNHATTGQKFYQDYKYTQAQEGVYAQAEYKKNNLTAFITVSASNTSDQKLDYFHYSADSANRKSKTVNFLGYQIKGGANYNIDEHNNIYANIGYIQRPPLIGGVFSNVNLNTINNQAVDEKLFDYELGYGYTSAMFTADVNAYRTLYRDRTQIFSDPTQQGAYVNVSGLNEIHEGVEVEAKLRPVSGVILGGMLSIGNYYYTSNTKGVTVSGEVNGKTQTATLGALPLKGVKIGDPGSSVTGGASATSAQTTAGFSADFRVLSSVTFGADYLYYGRYYAAYNPSKITAAGYEPYELPAFGTVDLHIVYKFKLAGLNSEFIGNVYNVLNNKYISEAYESNPQNAGQFAANRIDNITVDMGPQRYFMTTLKIKF